MSLGDCTVRIDDDQPTFWDRVEAGRWEPGTLALVAARVGPGTVLVDLGAWVGPITLLAAAAGADVVAVDADPAALAQLRRNLAANPDLAARVRVIEAAVAPRDGPVRLGARRKPGDSMSSVLLAGSETAWTAPGLTPAALAALLPPATPVFVKMDIEGAEYALLPHLAPLLARADAILISFHPDLLRDEEVRPLTEAALGPLAGWTAFAIGETGPVPAVASPEALARSRDWLFTATPGRASAA